MTARKLSSFAAIIAIGLFCGQQLPTSAARFPNAVEKRIVLSGAESADVAGLFGCNSNEALKLKLGKRDAWAVYLLKQDTKVALSNDNEGCPERINTLQFAENSISISPFWLDMATRAPAPKPGYYSFGSPLLAKSLDQNDAWTQLVRQLKKEPGWKEGNTREFARTYKFSNGADLTIEVYGGNEDWNRGHSVVITAHPAS